MSSSIEADEVALPPVVANANPWTVAVGALCVVVAMACGYHFCEGDIGHGQGGLNWKWHAGYWAAAAVVVLVLPFSVSQYIFSDLTETAAGMALPVYESVRACCTPPEDDDKLWLQYWMLGGLIFMLSTWVDDIIQSPTATEYWYEVSVFFLYWLYFPKTQGAKLFYEKVTKPYLTPILEPVLGRVEDFFSYLYNILINAAHLWVLWIIFFFLPKGLKRIIAILVGTAYPFLSSVAAAATDEIDDDTYWLTYWSVYGVLFLLMDIMETWLGWIPGFYTLVIFTTVYLMLPMFQGADKVFRKVLVPLAGLQEMLMLRDAIRIKKDMLKTLPPGRAKEVRKAIAKFYNDDDDSAQPEALKLELKSGWSSLTMPNLSGMFGGKSDASEPSEKTSLVV